MATTNNWYVVTGGPSSGKTTLLAELAKLGHQTFPEAAREVIDQAVAKGKTVWDLRADEVKFQMDILQHKLHTEAAQDNTELSFFDRGMHDTLAYLRLQNVKINRHVIAAMQASRYKRVFLLDPLAVYQQDYARTETPEEIRRLNALLHEAYEEYGMVPLHVPALPLPERVNFILQHIS